MELDDELESNDGKNYPVVFMLNQHKIRSAVGHPKVIVRILVEPGSRKMIPLHGLVNNCSTGIIIHPMVLKYINDIME